MKVQVLFGGENVWTENGQTQYFATYEEAEAELVEHFEDMDNAGMDYEPTDYRITEVN
jgi:CHASE3 domain sensor protein